MELGKIGFGDETVKLVEKGLAKKIEKACSPGASKD